MYFENNYIFRLDFISGLTFSINKFEWRRPDGAKWLVKMFYLNNDKLINDLIIYLILLFFI